MEYKTIVTMDRIFQIIALSLLISCINADDEYCYAKDDKPYELFSTWTFYDAVKGSGITDTATCKPIYFWVLMKHGIVHISDQEIEKRKSLDNLKQQIKTNYEEKRATLCAEDYQNIQSSSIILDKNKLDEILMKKAIENHESLASTLAGYLNSPPLSKEMFQFQTSKSNDAKNCAIAFSNKLLNTNYKDVSGNDIKENEALLRSSSDCPNWKTNAKEVNSFLSSSYGQELQAKFSSRLGSTKVMSWGDLWTVYETCAHDRVILSSKKAPYCACYTQDDLNVFEYMHDLKHYYEFGYGNPLSEKFGCPLINNLIDSISNAATDSNKLKGTFNIGDSVSLTGFLVGLGLLKDDQPLKHDNYPSFKTSRKWKSSINDPFTANLYVVLYNCENNAKKVELFYNQNSVKLPGCPDQRCPLDTFKTELKKLSKDGKCDEKFCTEGSSSSTMNVCSILIIFLGLFFSRL